MYVDFVAIQYTDSFKMTEIPLDFFYTRNNVHSQRTDIYPLVTSSPKEKGKVRLVWISTAFDPSKLHLEIFVRS